MLNVKVKNQINIDDIAIIILLIIIGHYLPNNILFWVEMRINRH